MPKNARASSSANGNAADNPPADARGAGDANGAATNAAADVRRQFARLRRFVGRSAWEGDALKVYPGAMADLTELETKAWVMLYCHADGNGECYPGIETIAGLIGTKNLNRARAALHGANAKEARPATETQAARAARPATLGLVGRGLVEVVTAGGGRAEGSARGKSNRYRLLAPPDLAARPNVTTGTLCVPDKLDVSRSQGGRATANNRDGARRLTGTVGVAVQGRAASPEQPIEQPNEHHHQQSGSAAARKGGGGGVMMEGEEAEAQRAEHARAQRRAALTIGKVTGAKLAKLSALTSLAPMGVLCLLLDLQAAEGREDVSALLIHRIENGGASLATTISLTDTRAMIAKRWIAAVSGHALGPDVKVTYNDNTHRPGLTLTTATGGEAFVPAPAQRLALAAFRVAQPPATAEAAA